MPKKDKKETRFLHQLGIQIYRNLKENEDQSKILLINPKNGYEINIKEFTTLAIQTAISLKNLGIKKGDLVAIISENCPKFAISVTALFFLGATTQLLNPNYTIGELKHFFNICKPKAVLCTNKSSETIDNLKEEFHLEEIINFDSKSFDELLLNVNYSEIVQFYPTEVNPEEDVALILASSGTTGFPKGVLLTYTNFATALNFFNNKCFFNKFQNEVILNYLPFFHIFGIMISIGGILFGSKVIITEKFIPDKFLESIQNYKVTLLFAVPTIVQFLAQSPLVLKYDLFSISYVFCGGSKALPATEEKLLERLNIPVIQQIYGMTESGPAIATPLNHLNKAGSVGKIVDQYQVKICDVTTGLTLGPNQNGEIYLKGAAITVGYCNDKEATKVAFDDEGYLRTGDLGYFDNDGYYYVIDRLKEIIKYKAFQVSPAELEVILLQHPCVKEAAVVGIPDERAEELPMAIIVKESNMKVTEEEILRFVAENVSIEKQLHGGVKFVESLPRTSLGKIIRSQLKDLV